ncbi:PaaI family thioesterase [Sphingomonas ginsenosidimutans]|jgi:uncharacterized protein (TIGR00369 family)|uniref:Thioesterase n=1 Tax=Sphingomonas ginsenosidimutans TaxID=862134 RepID=A0A2A4I1A7_9SPHN|nr:PaaI family thioesterase [Sphingomonas ginsenosidimutans]PCG09959.1 thioesterase [Sphingomonas ginsenosidimutans]
MTDDTDEPYGLMLLRDWIAHDRQPPMGRTLGIRLVEAERGRVVFEGTPDRSVYNPLGGVHGGYAATMLDSACGVAVASALGEGMGHTTLELKVSYQRGLTERSGTVRAEGRLISLGRRVAFSEANLVDGDGRLCATATSTLLVFEAASGQRGAFQQ